MKLLVEKNFSKVQETLRIFADVFGVLVNCKGNKFATLGTDRGGKESPLGGEEPVLFGPSGPTPGTGDQQDQVAAVPNALHPGFPFSSSPPTLTLPH